MLPGFSLPGIMLVFACLNVMERRFSLRGRKFPEIEQFCISVGSKCSLQMPLVASNAADLIP